MKAIWIEMAAEDIERANDFYAAVFGHDSRDVMRDAGRAIVVIPGDPIVSLNQTPGFAPDGHGTLPYFDVDQPLGDALAAVITAGGSIVEEISERPGYGFFALVADTEGNHMYVHSVSR